MYNVYMYVYIGIGSLLHLFEVFLNTILMLAQLELDGRAAAVVLGLESRDFTETLQVMQAPCSSRMIRLDCLGFRAPIFVTGLLSILAV